MTTVKTPYWELLQDPRWQKRRLDIMNRDGFKCVNCKAVHLPLHVHHRYYVKGRMPWNYPDTAFVTLCCACHPFIQECTTHAFDSWEVVLNALSNGSTTAIRALFDTCVSLKDSNVPTQSIHNCVLDALSNLLKSNNPKLSKEGTIP